MACGSLIINHFIDVRLRQDKRLGRGKQLASLLHSETQSRQQPTQREIPTMVGG